VINISDKLVNNVIVRLFNHNLTGTSTHLTSEQLLQKDRLKLPYIPIYKLICV